MCNYKFNSDMIQSLDGFTAQLRDEGRTTEKSIEEIYKRYALIEQVCQHFEVKSKTVVFYKNPFLFTLRDTYQDQIITSKVEGNKCLFMIEDKDGRIVDQCLINFTTKRFLVVG